MKKRNYPSDIFEFIFSKFIVFFLFVSYLLSISVSYFFPNSSKKKSFFGGPTKYTKKFLHSGIVSTVFCLIPEKTKREIIYLEHCLFLASHLFVSPQPHISSKKKFGNILSQNILEKIIYYKRLYVVEFWSTVQNCLGLPDI